MKFSRFMDVVTGGEERGEDRKEDKRGASGCGGDGGDVADSDEAQRKESEPPGEEDSGGKHHAGGGSGRAEDGAEEGSRERLRAFSWYLQYANVEDTFPGLIPNLQQIKDWHNRDRPHRHAHARTRTDKEEKMSGDVQDAAEEGGEGEAYGECASADCKRTSASIYHRRSGTEKQGGSSSSSSPSPSSPSTSSPSSPPSSPSPYSPFSASSDPPVYPLPFIHDHQPLHDMLVWLGANTLGITLMTQRSEYSMPTQCHSLICTPVDMIFDQNCECSSCSYS